MWSLLLLVPALVLGGGAIATGALWEERGRDDKCWPRIGAVLMTLALGLAFAAGALQR